MVCTRSLKGAAGRGQNAGKSGCVVMCGPLIKMETNELPDLLSETGQRSELTIFKRKFMPINFTGRSSVISNCKIHKTDFGRPLLMIAYASKSVFLWL